MIRRHCLVCDSSALKQIIDLGSHPFADTFVPESHLGEADSVYPLVCDLCTSCGHVQTRYETDPNKRYSQVDYSYTSSNSAFACNHWDAYVREVGSAVNLKPNAFVVDIGSNDGYLPEQFIKAGYRAIGVDASPYMAELAKKRGVTTFTGLFGKENAEKIMKEYGKADLVSANNVYNHADNPLAFTEAVSTILVDNGNFVFEQPYWPIGVQSGKFDQIYHEHVSYFTVKSAVALLTRAGLSVVSAEIVDYHGGSLHIIARKSAQISAVPDNVKKMIEKEEKEGMFDLTTYQNFMKQNLMRRSRFLQKVHKIKESGYPIIAVGAPAKGNTFLNFYNLDNSTIDYATDASPYKKGKYTPATRIPIVGDEIFEKYDKVYALILSWNIAPQLKNVLSKHNTKIEFISPDMDEPVQNEESIKKIYSKVDPSVLLHVVYKHSKKERVESKKFSEISHQDHFLQAIAVDMPANIVVKPHAHNLQKRESSTTHEALVLLSGSVELSVFDIDKSLVEKMNLDSGDCYMIVNGGHSIRTLTDAQFIEFKNGPYTGPEKDKTYFN